MTITDSLLTGLSGLLLLTGLVWQVRLWVEKRRVRTKQNNEVALNE